MKSMDFPKPARAPRAPSAPARPAQLRQANARELLRLLQQHAPCSKADLVRLSGLSAPSISSMVGQLQELGLVLPIGEGESSGGRPPTMLQFHARHAYVAAADIGGTRIRMMLADLSGTPVAHWSAVMQRRQKTPTGVCQLIHEGLRTMCASANASLDKVLHLTAGAPGITNATTGIVLSAPNLCNWNDVPLRSLLQGETGIQVIAENDVNLAAIGEHRSGAARGVNNFVFVAVGTGVGAGIFLRGEIHHGAQWTAGEIGYFGVRDSAPEPIRMRDTGQLERQIGGAGIERYWRELVQAQPDYDASLPALHAPAIFDHAQTGDPLALQVLTHTAGVLADVIADISLLLNPELVVLGGGIGAHPELSRVTQTLLAQNEFANPQVRPSVLGREAQLFGAISLSLAAAEANLLH